MGMHVVQRICSDTLQINDNDGIGLIDNFFFFQWTCMILEL